MNSPRHSGPDMRAATLCGYCWTTLTPPARRAGDLG